MKFLSIIMAFIAGCNNQLDNQTQRWWTEEDRQLILSELNRTTTELKSEIDSLSTDQWSFREDSDRWNIGEVVEHLEMQNQLHYREISIILNSPQHLEYRIITKGEDGYFTQYATDTSKGQANWFLQPKGKFKSKEAAEEAFYLARKELSKLVRTTTVDLRKQFSFRVPANEKKIDEFKIGEVRDLHQLLLTGIAHTDRHLRQIRRIKSHPSYPHTD